MGISERSDVGAAGDSFGVGSLVWVRRRNGSWWPGRILGPEELPSSTILSPKSGTPVKLLGREDASVEWYNLEKSIRVKAFRCGEFDDCIERAEASQGVPIKRREKYARREDAILHALELERKQHKPGVMPDSISTKTPSVIKRELDNCFSESYAEKSDPAGCSQFTNHKSQMLSRRGFSSLEEDDDMGNPLYVHKGRNNKPFRAEEVVPESIPRTRGLQDFGLRIAPAKKKDFQFVEWDSLQRPVDNHLDVLPCAGQNIGGARYAGIGKNSLPLKKKSFQGGMPEESHAKRRDRRRPLLKVLESSAKLTSFDSFQPDHDVGTATMQGEKDHMGAICRAKRSRCIYLPADSNDSPDHLGNSFKQMPTSKGCVDSSYDYHGSLADENTSSGFEAVDSDSSGRGYSENNMEEENNLLRDTKTLLAEIHPHEHTADAPAEVGVSKWHMKGKRNIRSSAKSPIDIMDSTIGNGADKGKSSLEGTSNESKETEFKMGRIDHSIERALGHAFYPKREFSACDEGDFSDKDTSLAQSIGCGNQRYPVTLKAAKGRGSSFIDSDDDSAAWEADRTFHAARRTYWREPEYSAPAYVDHLGDEMEPMLVDVDLQVRASYKGEHVPLVSLMSRLNGKAIIGHPIQVEILEDSRKEPSRDGSSAPSPVWKTARRTAIQRIPRSNPPLSALEGEESEPLSGIDIASKPLSKKAHSSPFSQQARLAKKCVSRSASGKFQRKLLKSVNISGQKIRTLSSLSLEQKQHISKNSDAKFNRLGGILGGLIKPEGTMPPITCVPVKVVFSRILEAFDRPSSSVAHPVLVTDSTLKDTS